MSRRFSSTDKCAIHCQPKGLGRIVALFAFEGMYEFVGSKYVSRWLNLDQLIHEGILELLVLRLDMTEDEVISHLNRMRNVCDRYEENSELRHNVMSQPQTKIIEELFASLGRMSWQSFVKNRLPLLNLPPDVLELLRSGQLEYTKARASARVKDEETRKQLLLDTIEYNLSLSEIKRKIKEIEQQSQPETPSIKDLADDTFRRLKKSQIWDGPKKKAKVEKLLAQLKALIEDDNPIA